MVKYSLQAIRENINESAGDFKLCSSEYRTVTTYTVRTVLSCILVKNTFLMVYSLRHFVSLN